MRKNLTFALATAALLFSSSQKLLAQSWSLTGNAGTVTNTNFLGTTDNKHLMFRTKNVERMRLSNLGNLGIGTKDPFSKLHVSGGVNNNLTSGGYIIAGDLNSFNLAMDVGALQARNDSATAPLYLNYYGGAVWLGKVTPNIAALYAAANGNVGIGINTPSTKLHVAGTETLAGNLNFTDGTQSIQFAIPGSSPAPMMYMFPSGTVNTDRMVIAHSPSFPNWGLRYSDLSDDFDFLSNGTSVMRIDLSSQNVGLGTTTPVYKLDVCGTIRAKEVRVETGWCDYVFEKDYKLRSIDELETYINDNKHLPGIAPASEVEKDGLKVAEMNKAMMEKIEELSLYVIQLSKENKKLQSEMEALKK